MNKLLLSFFSFLLLLSANSASAETPPVDDNREIRNRIYKAISYPEMLEPMNDVEIVLVSFQIETCGMITVLSSNASNPEFKDYVVKKLENMRCSEGDGSVHNMRFVFRGRS